MENSCPTYLKIKVLVRELKCVFMQMMQFYPAWLTLSVWLLISCQSDLKQDAVNNIKPAQPDASGPFVFSKKNPKQAANTTSTCRHLLS